LFTDLIAGLVRQNVAQAVGDFVVRRADHIFAYQFAVVVDDAAMQINQVVRGADLLHSTPRQLQLFAALGASPPEYAHVPLVLNDAGERLAKRDHSSCIRELRNAGLEPAQLIGLLGNSLGLLETSAPSGLGKLIDAFDWKKIHTHPWHWEAYSPRQA
jgi:glutamyl-tRNA synthetase